MGKIIEDVASLEMQKIYSDHLIVKIHVKYMGFDCSVAVTLLNEEKSPDCHITHKGCSIDLRTKKGIKGEKYESIEELKQECYDALKSANIEPITMIVSDLIYMYTYPFTEDKEDKCLPEVVRIEDDIKLGDSIRMVPSNEILVITKSFAEDNLSEDAISYAAEVNGYYVWELNKASWVVLFEIPTIFDANFQEVLRGVITYNIDYLRKNNLNDNVIYHVFKQNQKKKIIKKCR